MNLDSIRNSYPAKLVIAFGFVMLVIGAVGVGIYVQTDRTLQADTRTDLESAARIESQALDEWFTEKQLEVTAISESAPLHSGNDSQAIQYLWDVVDRDDDIEAAYFVDTANETVITSVGSARVISSAAVSRATGQRAFMGDSARGAVAVSAPFRAYEGGAPVLLMSTELADRPSRRLVVVVNLRQLSDSQPHQLDQARFQVINANGTVIMADDSTQILQQTAFADYDLQGTGFLEAQEQTHDVAIGHAELQGRDWTVVAWMPSSQAYALRSTTTELLVGMLGVALIGFGAIGLLLTRTTIQPLRDLTERAQRLKVGDLEDPIPTTRGDEYGELYDAFEEMRVSLQAQIQRAERARLESEEFSHTLQAEADRFGDVMAACAEGQLDRRLHPTTETESMQKIADAFNAMMDDVERQTEELEAFTSIISHDLRNPLNVSLGRLELLAEETDSGHLDPIQGSLDRMQRIIDDGMTLARGTQPETKSVTDLESRARNAWNHVESHDATLEIRATRPVLADLHLLDQAFENLFRNAIEHGGHDVTVTVEPIEEGFVVEDDGPGLPPDQVDAVFDPGFTSRARGTGLGLTIVQRIATAHGWTVTASNGHHGARFEVHTGPTPESGDDATQGTVFDAD